MKIVAAIIGVGLIVGIGYMVKQDYRQSESNVGGIELYGIDSGQTKPQAQGTAAPEQNTASLSTTTPMNYAILKTNKGDITIQLAADLAPNTVKNFVTLAQQGFYDGTKFHRVIENFMIQGGDPLSKDDAQINRWGTGGPGYTFADEIHAQNRNAVGTIAMANAGPNTNGSQFFINVADNNFLDAKHTVFGVVTEGLENVLSISKTETDGADRPVEAVIIESVELR